MAETIYLRVYAEGRPGQFEAVCLDLDIAGQGPTLEAALDSLRGSVKLYLESLHELPEAERERFLHRRAPLGMRIKFLWHVVKMTFTNRDDGNPKERAEMILNCPA